MANVEAEPNTAPSQQTEAIAPSETVALNEENLEALLRGVSGTAFPARPPAPVSPSNPNVQASSVQDQIAAPPMPPAANPIHDDAIQKDAVEKDRGAEEASKPEPAQQHQESVQLAALQEDRPVEAAPPPPFEAAPVAVAPLQASPQAAPQPDVNSKLALISAIKQRRAVTPRPESPEGSAPVAQPGERLEQEAEPRAKEKEDVAAAMEIETASGARQTPEAATRNVTEVAAQKAGLPAKKVWNNGSTAAPSEQDSVRADAPPALSPRPEIARKSAPKPTVAAAPAQFAETSEGGDLFATFGSGVQEQPKPKSFLASKAGMGVIGGAIAAAAVIIYLLTAHGSKSTPVANPPASAPVEVASAVAPAATPTPDSKTSTSTTASSQQHATPSPSVAQSSAKPAATPVSPSAVQQVPTQQPTARQSAAPQQPAVPETPRTVARAFTAPTVARPTSNAIIDAAPNVTINSAAPAAVALPARIAPLPPPPAPAAPAPAAAAQPRQLAVAGAVQAAKLTRQVVPMYPAVAKAARVQGVVHFRAVINTDGTVKSLTTLGGPLPLAQAAADAVKQWRYQPTVVDGKPVEVTTQIDVAFTL